MSKHAGGKLSFSNLSHGKKVGHTAQDHFGPIESHGHKPGHKHEAQHGGTGPKVAGYVDWARPIHDAKGHDVGHRGPFTSANKGRHKHSG